VLDEELGNIGQRPEVAARPDERGFSILVFSVDVRAVFDEEFGDVRESFFAGPDERRDVIICGGIGVGAVIDEELGDLREAQGRGQE
jgi:hypothetical protein